MSKQSTHKKPLILIDGSSYLFRAFHALPPLTNSKGMPTGAIYGVLNMIRKLLKEYQPEHVAVVFDPKGGCESRKKIYAEYKANREVMPDDLQVQIKPLHEAIRALGIPLIIIEGVEADDVIGTLAMHAKQHGISTLVSTGDKDMAQLVDEQITMINTMTNRQLDSQGVFEKFGVTPDRMVDYLALVGDNVDNIPGVPMVGPKTAAKWLQQYGSLTEIITHANEIKGKVGENLRASLTILPLNKELVTIKLDVDLNFSPKDLNLKTPDRQKLLELFTELEFRSWLADLLTSSDTPSPTAETHYVAILDQQTLAEQFAQLKKIKEFSFNIETTSLDAMSAKWIGFSFAMEPNKAFYVPLAHDYLGAPEQIDQEQVLAQLKELLNNSKITIIGHDLKYDMKILRRYDIEIKAKMSDTLLEAYILNNTSAHYDINSLALKYLAKNTIKFEDVVGKGAKQLTFNQIHLKQATEYASQNADVALQLHQKLISLINEQSAHKQILNDIEIPLVPVLMTMEYNGVLVDAKKLQKQSHDITQRIHAIEEKVYILAGEEFNLSSPKQLQTILFEKLKLPTVKKTPKGQSSTAEGVLQELALQYELPKLILQHRSLSKIKSTYTDRLPLQINAHTGRVHTRYNQAVTSTGRLSSTDPNLQNIPIRSEEGRKIRQAFIAPEGSQMIAADYSQIELRIMAHISQDLGLLHAFEQGVDIHRATAAEVFNVDLSAVTADQRRSAKAINFGLMYGMSSFGLAQQLNIDQALAQSYIDVYFSRYPNVYAYMKKIRELAAKQGFVETLFGRRLWVLDINAQNLQRRRAAERAAINAPLQGSAADIIKLAMISVDSWIQYTKIAVKMIMQVHDELVFEVKQQDVEEAREKIKELMEKAAQLIVPLVVDVGMGKNWDEAH